MVRRGRRFWLCRFDRLVNRESVRHSSRVCETMSDHGRTSGLTVRFEDLALVLSQCVDLGLLAVAAS